MIGKPYSGKLNVRFDEGELEIEHGEALVRHCQTKGTETDRPNLNYYASSLLYPRHSYDRNTTEYPVRIDSNGKAMGIESI